MHRRMRQLSLTETETFVNLAKHALETLNASDDEDAAVAKDGVPAHYSDDDADSTDDHLADDDPDAAVVSPTSFKTIRSEPVFKNKRQKRLGMVLGMGQMNEAENEVEADGRWLGSPEAVDDDILHFVARSTSDVGLANSEQKDDNDDAEPSGDETTHLATAKHLLLC